MTLTNAQKQARWRARQRARADALTGTPTEIADKLLRQLSLPQTRKVLQALDLRLRNIKADCKACHGTGFLPVEFCSPCRSMKVGSGQIPCDCKPDYRDTETAVGKYASKARKAVRNQGDSGSVQNPAENTVKFPTKKQRKGLTLTEWQTAFANATAKEEAKAIAELSTAKMQSYIFDTVCRLVAEMTPPTRAKFIRHMEENYASNLRPVELTEEQEKQERAAKRKAKKKKQRKLRKPAIRLFTAEGQVLRSYKQQEEYLQRAKEMLAAEK